MSHSTIRRLATGFAAQAGVPVYAADEVPQGADCPFVTYALEEAAWGQRGRLTLTAWTREDFAGCMLLLDSLLGQLAGGQELLCAEDCAALVRFEQADTVKASADRSMIGGRLRLALYAYQGKEDEHC